jgi:hypothetical protein|uniref:Uncharacterized protein n=1 Tax=Siphoviridae sp. ctX926 TaxID=2826366 RepID=A0A8S5M1M3_9CAUD|nr:MAG TPA: hypothetical protein [Siphoviridae sp. ctX926]
MGGRGSSSRMGAGKTGRSAASLDKKIENINTQLEKIVRSNGSAMNLPDRYYSLQRKRQGLEAQRRKLLDAKLKNRKSTDTSTTRRKFVNGYGEATTREITSASYKRSQRRLDKEIDNRFKGR